MHILRESILYLKRKHTHIKLHRSKIKNRINFDIKYSKKGFLNDRFKNNKEMEQFLHF